MLITIGIRNDSFWKLLFLAKRRRGRDDHYETDRFSRAYDATRKGPHEIARINPVRGSPPFILKSFPPMHDVPLYLHPVSDRSLVSAQTINHLILHVFCSPDDIVNVSL